MARSGVWAITKARCAHTYGLDARGLALAVAQQVCAQKLGEMLDAADVPGAKQRTDRARNQIAAPMSVTDREKEPVQAARQAPNSDDHLQKNQHVAVLRLAILRSGAL